MDVITHVLQRMIAYESGLPRRVNHFLKVYSFARIIAEAEGLSAKDRYVLELAAAMHDCGILASLNKYGYYNGRLQEEEGPAVAETILAEFPMEQSIVERVKYLIGHHHTYNEIDGLDYQILVEADFLVNVFEREMQKEAILEVKDKYFKTKTGTAIFEKLYPV